MKVKELMTPTVKAIWLTEFGGRSKNDVGQRLRSSAGHQGRTKVIGMITDRDVCMAIAMRDTNPRVSQLKK